jgi:hypothetical protein
MSHHYPLLWVRPQIDVENVPSLEQLDCELNGLHASVMYGTSEERKVFSQTAIRVYGDGDEQLVSAKLAELHYEIVGREVRRTVFV